MHGYRKIPVLIPFLTGIYFLLPFLSLIQFQSSTHDFGRLLHEIIFSRYFLWEVFCAWTAAAAIYSVTTFGFFYFMTLSLITIAQKFISITSSDPFLSIHELMVMMLWLWVSAVMLVSTLRIPYLNPRTRWWKQQERYVEILKGVLSYQEVKFPIVALNVSEGGVFVKLDERTIHAPTDASLNPQEVPLVNRRRQGGLDNPFLEAGDVQKSAENLSKFPDHVGLKALLQIAIHPDQAKKIEWELLSTEVEVVWLSKPGSPYRFGLGLKFMNQNADQKKIWIHFLNRLNKVPHKKIRP